MVVINENEAQKVQKSLAAFGKVWLSRNVCEARQKGGVKNRESRVSHSGVRTVG